MNSETERQIFHMCIGIAAMIFLLIYGRGATIAAVFFTIITGTLLMNGRLLGKPIPLVQWFEERFERKNAPLPGWGSAAYAAGTLILLTVLTDVNEIAAGIFILAVGDAVSTIIGKAGTHGLPYNKNKTIEGMAAFFLASLPVFYIVGPVAVPVAFITMMVESLPALEDNLSIPIACAVLFLVF